MCCRTSLGAAEAQPARIESSAAYRIDTNRHRAPSRRSRPTVIASKRRHAGLERPASPDSKGPRGGQECCATEWNRTTVQAICAMGASHREHAVNHRPAIHRPGGDASNIRRGREQHQLWTRPAGGGREAGHHGWRIIARHPHMSGDRSWQCHWDRFSSRRFSNVSKDTSNSSWLRSSLSRGRSRATLGLPVRSI